MTKPRKLKEYKPKPSKSGTMVCNSQHRWIVVDQNTEREVVPCPVCGSLTPVTRLEK